MRQKGAKKGRRAAILEQKLSRKLIRHSLFVLGVHVSAGADWEEPIERPEGEADVIPSRGGEGGREGRREGGRFLN